MMPEDTADQADRWLRTRRTAPPSWSALGHHARQETTLSLLQRIDDLKTELRGERARADRLEDELLLANRIIAHLRHQRATDHWWRLALLSCAFVAALGVWLLLFATPVLP